MAVRTTKKCPYCGAVLSSFEVKRPRNGEMVRICPSCGHYYVDDDYFELALLTRRRRIEAGLTLGTISVAIFALIGDALLSAVDDMAHLDGIFSDNFGVVYAVLFVLFEAIHLKGVFAREESFLEDSELIASYQRLRNPIYRMQIEKLGYNIDPDCYYYKIKEKKEREEATKSQSDNQTDALPFMKTIMAGLNEELYDDNEFCYDEDYAVVPEKPIMTKGISESEAVLAWINEKLDKQYSWKRNGSQMVETIKHPIDLYVGEIDNEPPIFIYACPYGNNARYVLPKRFEDVSDKMIGQSTPVTERDTGELQKITVPTKMLSKKSVKACIVILAIGLLAVCAFKSFVYNLAFTNQQNYVAVNRTETIDYTTTSLIGLRNATWDSSDETVATVNEEGVVTGNRIGKCTITATVGNQMEQCDLYVVTDKEWYIIGDRWKGYEKNFASGGAPAIELSEASGNYCNIEIFPDHTGLYITQNGVKPFNWTYYNQHITPNDKLMNFRVTGTITGYIIYVDNSLNSKDGALIFVEGQSVNSLIESVSCEWR